MKQRWPLAAAERVAEELSTTLASVCDRIQVAGSVRRRSADVGDIELLCISRAGGDQALGTSDLLEQRIIDLVQRGVLDYRLDKRGRRTFGPWNKYLVHLASGIPVDLFSATAPNWGMAFLVRTGPREWNIKVVSRFKALGMRGHAYGGVTDSHGRELSCPTEEGVFRLLGWEYLEPESRQ